jgi:outer membrane immunogenic protein
MTKFVTLGVALAPLLAAPAMAADLPLKVPPAPMPAATANWAGSYVGVNVGWGWQNADSAYSSVEPPINNFSAGIAVGALPAATSQSSSGVLGGLTLGYNLQGGSFVYGIEADAMRTDLSATAAVATHILGFPEMTTATTTKVDWLATVRGRIGVLLAPEALLYATAGLAAGHVVGSASITPTGLSSCATNGFCSVGSGSATNLGWAAGVGAEYMFAPHWTAKVEYLHYDLGSFSYTINEASTAPVFLPLAGTPNVNVKTSVTGDVVRAGVNLKF